MLNLTKETFEDAIADGVVLVDFWAGWCGFCRMLEPVVDALQSKHGSGLKVAKVNVDSQPELAARYGVTALPTIIVFVNGEEADRRMGMQTIEALEGMIAGRIAQTGEA